MRLRFTVVPTCRRVGIGTSARRTFVMTASKNEAHCTLLHAAAMDGFYREWRQESNPWEEAHKSEVEGGGTFRSTSLLFLAVFALLNVVGKYFGKRRPNSPLSTRPTVLAGTFHALATSIISIYLLVARPPGDVIEGNEQQNGSSDCN